MPIVVSSPPGVAVGLVLNPTDDGFPTELNIGDGNNYGPKEASFPPPAPKPAYASSYDTEGSIATDEAHYENREITIGMTVADVDAAATEGRLNDLYKMVGQINREGGVLKFTTPAGTACYFDLVPEANANLTVDFQYLWRNRAEVTLSMMARPFWRGAEVDLGTTSETTLPWLILTELGPDGDVPALGRLVITEADGDDQWTVIVGGQSRYYSSAATAALAYQAEDLTPTGTSTDTAGAAGASGTNVIRNTDLTTTYQAILKSEIDPTNAALTHKGTYRIWARLYRPTGNTGAVSVRLEWAEGDFLRVTQNDPVSYAADDREGVFTWANLGIVSIDPASTRWEFRLLAKSTVVGDEIDADCFVLFPTEVVYTELSAKVRFENPSAFSARDEFDGHTTGADLTTKTAPIGGAWTGGGDANDFTTSSPGVPTSPLVMRDDMADTAPRVDWLPVSMTNVVVQADVFPGAIGLLTGGANNEGPDLVGAAAVVDATNYFSVSFKGRNTERALQVTRSIAGSRTVVDSYPLEGRVTFQDWHRLRLKIDTAGRWWVYWALIGKNDPGGLLHPLSSLVPTLLLSGQDDNLATGSTLATRKPGLVDYVSQNPAGGFTRYYEDFFAFVPTPDAAMFASQTLELAHDSAKREPSGGGDLTTISDRRGRYLKIPPGGPEGRSTRLVIKGFGNDPYTMGDAGIHDISAQLFVTPRGLVIPEA